MSVKKGCAVSGVVHMPLVSLAAKAGISHALLLRRHKTVRIFHPKEALIAFLIKKEYKSLGNLLFEGLRSGLKCGLEVHGYSRVGRGFGGFQTNNTPCFGASDPQGRTHIDALCRCGVINPPISQVEVCRAGRLSIVIHPIPNLHIHPKLIPW
ncbi:hypothetical protein F5Y09DRAFT_284839 [Xylaria sp. FL1042]|nr:hypothetical protein F5Y09DRAFT_284839 [Xylaria sp. FL1042]